MVKSYDADANVDQWWGEHCTRFTASWQPCDTSIINETDRVRRTDDVRRKDEGIGRRACVERREKRDVSDFVDDEGNVGGENRKRFAVGELEGLEGTSAGSNRYGRGEGER